MFSSDTTQVSNGGYQISRSLRFNSADSAYLNRTPASAGNRRTFTYSAWVKRSFVGTGFDMCLLNGYVDNSNRFSVDFANASNANLYILNNTAGTSTIALSTAALFRDPSAWYHVVVAIDTTQATSTNRVLVYVNGVSQTLSGTYPSQNEQLIFNYGIQQTIGVAGYSGLTNYFSGYQTEANFIDGTQLTPSSFGETNAQTGVWQPKAYSGSYGTNGFYLNFSDNSNTTAATLGKDYSGNGNNWTPNNFSVTAGAGNDSLVDSPTSYGTDTGVGGTVRGNYATLNPLDKSTNASAVNGNLDVTSTGATWVGIRATFGMQTGKWYCEYTPTSGTFHIVSVSQPQASTAGYIIDSPLAYGYQWDGQKVTNNTGSSYGSTWGVGDIIGIAFDADAGTITFFKNNISQGVAFSGLTSGPYIVGLGFYPTATGTFNFGQRPFAYTAPSGYKALCTQNLPTPTIGATTATQAGKYFNPVLYTGNGGTQTVTGVGFQPDFLWIKARSSASSHYLMNAVTGAGVSLESQSTVAEANYSAYLSQFNSDGFYMPTSAGGFNASGVNFVAWNWKANGTGSTNTAGSITSTVSANTTSGFSVVTYTGNGTVVAANGTVGHGLGVVPSMIIIKRRDNTGFWYVATKDGGTSTSPTYSLFTRGSSGLNQTGAAFTTGQSYASSGYISSTTFNLYWLNAAVTAGDSYDINFLTGTYVAYCFAEVAGYSKFGSYTGNNSADGPFVFTGMRPAYVMVKRTDTSGFNWIVYDTTRDTYNVAGKELLPNTADAEATYPILDFLSNGFKIRIAATSVNASGGTYIYMAFATNPFKYSLAR